VSDSLEGVFFDVNGTTVPAFCFLELRFLHQQMKVGGGLALFTFESSIVLSLITLFSDINTLKTLKEVNLTLNHTTPMVSEILIKQSVNEENSSLFMNNIL
jgi:hypothetical protein